MPDPNQKPKPAAPTSAPAQAAAAPASPTAPAPQPGRPTTDSNPHAALVQAMLIYAVQNCETDEAYEKAKKQISEAYEKASQMSDEELMALVHAEPASPVPVSSPSSPSSAAPAPAKHAATGNLLQHMRH